MLAKNESQLDRAIRLIVGLVLLIIGTYVSGWLQIVLYILAIIALLTAALGVCLLYKLFGWNTNQAKPEAAKSAEPMPTEAAPAMNTPAEEAEAELEVETPAQTPAAAPAEETEVKTETPQ